jgi:hypothetical protein
MSPTKEKEKDDLESEIERNLEIIHGLGESNKKFELQLHQFTIRSDTEQSSAGKQKSTDFRSSSSSIKNTASTGQLTKVRSEKSTEFMKASLLYFPVKVKF